MSQKSLKLSQKLETTISNQDSFAVRICKFLLFSLPFLFLYVPSWVPYPHITFKAFALRLIVTLTLFVYLVFVKFKKEKLQGLNGAMVYSLLGFVVMIFFSDVINGKAVSIFGSVVRMTGFIDTLSLLLYSFLIVQLLRAEDILKVFRFWLYSSIYVFAATCLNYYSDFINRRPGVIYGNPIHLGIFALFMFIISLAFFDTTRKWYYFLFAFMNFTVIMMTADKSVFLGLLFALGSYVVCIFLKE